MAKDKKLLQLILSNTLKSVRRHKDGMLLWEGTLRRLPTRSVIFLPKLLKLHLIIREHWLNQGHFTKLTKQYS